MYRLLSCATSSSVNHTHHNSTSRLLGDNSYHDVFSSRVSGSFDSITTPDCDHDDNASEPGGLCLHPVDNHVNRRHGSILSSDDRREIPNMKRQMMPYAWLAGSSGDADSDGILSKMNQIDQSNKRLRLETPTGTPVLKKIQRLFG